MYNAVLSSRGGALRRLGTLLTEAARALLTDQTQKIGQSLKIMGANRQLVKVSAGVEFAMNENRLIVSYVRCLRARRLADHGRRWRR